MSTVYPFTTHFRVQSGAVSLAVHACGNPLNPVLILIHGYPDSHHVWSALAAELAERFRVIAYDVRGCGESDTPAATRDYSLQNLRNDLVAVMDAVSPNAPVHLVAHDWGSIQTWESVTDPSLQARIASFNSLSGPCLDHVGQLLRHYALNPGGGNLAKMLKQTVSSWYIWMFQAPLLAPTLWKTWLAEHWDDVLAKAEGIPHGLAHNPTQKRDGVNGIGLYRANILQRLLAPRERYTDVPVQLLIAASDNYVGTQLFDRLELWVSQLSKRDVPGGHWHMILREPQQLAAHISEFALAHRP